MTIGAMRFDARIGQKDAGLAERHARTHAGTRRVVAAREYHLLLTHDIDKENRPAVTPCAAPPILPPRYVARQPR